MSTATFATDTDHSEHEAHLASVGSVAPSAPEGQMDLDTQRRVAQGALSVTDADQGRIDTQFHAVGSVANSSEGTASDRTNLETHWLTVTAVPSEQFTLLRVYAESLDDAIKHRMALQNRLRSGTVESDVNVEINRSLEHVEKSLRREMIRALRLASPEIAAWAKETVGLAEATVARLLGVIGDPALAFPHHWEGEGSARKLVADEPFKRTVSQLWSYCGHGDARRKRRKGMTWEDGAALGSPHAKTLVHLLAECAVKAGVRRSDGAEARFTPETRKAISPLGQVYLDRRIHTWDREDWSDGHKHNDALRIVGKEILKQMWIVAAATR